MKLTKTSDYALRLITYLAKNKTLKSTPEISGTLHVSYNNMIKLVQKLSKVGLISTKQGKYGGICLEKKPKDISIKEVIEAIEGPVSLSDCKKTKRCDLYAHCELRFVFEDIQEKINESLASVSIEDVMKRGLERRELCHP